MQCVSPDDADVQVQDPEVLQMHPQDCPSVGLSEKVGFFGKQHLSTEIPRRVSFPVAWDPSRLAGMHLDPEHLDAQGREQEVRR